MSELSCDTPFIGQIETHNLVRYLKNLKSREISILTRFGTRLVSFLVSWCDFMYPLHSILQFISSDFICATTFPGAPQFFLCACQYDTRV